jgi:damage-control phosphatase, subfamily I
VWHASLAKAHEAVVAATPDQQLQDTALREALQMLACADWHLPPPAMAQPIHRLIRARTRNPDPYAAVKERLNQCAEELYPTWQRRFNERFMRLSSIAQPALTNCRSAVCSGPT